MENGHAMMDSKWIVLGFLLFSCQNSTETTVQQDWGIPSYSFTNVTPEPGTYKFSQEGYFTVKDEITLRFSIDGYRWDNILISYGNFYHTWGTADSTRCPNCSMPTDSYAISGHFTSPTEAEGTIVYGAWGDHQTNTFTATLPVLDAGTATP
jgi:hypothetical protein